MQPGIKLNIKKPEGSYFLTLTIVDWVDIFTRDRYSKIVIETLRYCILNKGLHLFAYVIMSNHIHMIVNCDLKESLSDIIRDFKRFSSKRIVDAIKNEPESRREWMLELFARAANTHAKQHSFKVWQDGNHAIEVFSEKFTWAKVLYIHQNPVRAGLVSEPTHWMYSSASNYQDLDAVLKEVVTLSPPLNYGLNF